MTRTIQFFSIICFLFASVSVAGAVENRVGQTTATTGTGTIDLSSAANDGQVTFASVYDTGDTVTYLIQNADQTQWEIGTGTFTDAATDTISRDDPPESSSNAGALVDFSAGTKDVYNIVSAAEYNGFSATGSAFDGWDKDLSDDLALGETETTAYRGDRGKTAYDHSQTAHAPAGAEANPDLISQAEAEAGTSTTERTFSALRVKQAIDALGGSAGEMNVPTGATLPTSPSDGDLFLHAPTGRKILYQYTDSTWNSIQSYGEMTLYVDATDGSDTLSDHGTAVDGDAFATIQFAIDCIPGLVGGDVVINLNAETYTEDIIFQGKSFTGPYSITMKGTLSQQSTATMDSAVQGTGSTQGSITDTGAFGSYDNMMIYDGTDYRIIDSDTSNTATIVATWGTAPTGTYYVYDWGTEIVSTSIGITISAGQQNIYIEDLKITGNRSGQIYSASSASFTRCSFDSSASIGMVAYGSLFMDTCYFNYTGSSRSLFLVGNSSTIYRSKFYGNNGSRVGIWLEWAMLTLSCGCILDGFDDGYAGALYVSLNSGVLAYSGDSSGLHIIRNNTKGAKVFSGGQVMLSSDITYSGNTTDESVDAASFGHID